MVWTVFNLARHVLLMSLSSTQRLHPAAKAGIVIAGFILALAVAMAVMGIRQQLNANEPSQGMQAFGDLIVGVAVFSALATVPLGCALYWLRPVTRFWNLLAIASLAYAATGLLALAVSGPLRPALGNWALLGDLRIGTMPVSALAAAVCAFFAPATRLKLVFAGVALLDGALFGAVLLRLMLSAG